MKHIINEFEERYFIGIEFDGGVQSNSMNKIPELWSEFMKDIALLKDAPLIKKYIGLECYPPDFVESQVMDYYAMVQTQRLVEMDGFVSKKLPAGRYIQFEIEFDDLPNQIQQVYQYLKQSDIHYHNMFDVEDYLPDQDYNSSGAILYFSFLLKED